MADNKTILVVGGGMAGITTALEAAEVGQNVILIERNPYLGGRVAQLYKYFPKLCPPGCGLEINYKRIKNNPRISVYTQAEVASVSGEEGDFEVQVKLSSSGTKAAICFCPPNSQCCMLSSAAAGGRPR